MKLKAKTREITGRKVKNLRAKGEVPASVFGPGFGSKSIEVNDKEFRKLFDKVGFNKFFNLEIEDQKPFLAIVKDVQIHPVKDNILSIGIYKINEDRKITVEVPITFEGESPAEKNKVGFLVYQIEGLKIYTLPKDLPAGFTVDISKLENPGDAVPISEIQLPEGVELDSSVEPTYAIVYVSSFQKEEVVEEKPAEEGASAEGQPASEGGEKKEGE